MKRTFVPLALALMLGAPTLQAQAAQDAGKGRPNAECRRRCDGSGKATCKGHGMRKQDGTGPRGGTTACPKTPAK
jgi:hypothetical protein